MLIGFLSSIEVNLKDIIRLGGIKKNYFTGYGLVVGLRGTGDRRSLYTSESLKNVLKNYGLKGTSLNRNLSPRNVASVIISAETTGYLNSGDIVDITVASIGDARSIDNGFLIPSSLRAANGTTYIVGSGIITTERNHLTRGVVVSGGIVERNFSDIALNDYSFPLDLRINSYYSGNVIDIKEKLLNDFPELIRVDILGEKRIAVNLVNQNQENPEKIISDILNTDIEIDTRNKVVIDTETGIIVSGENIAIDSSYISLPLDRSGFIEDDLGEIDNEIKSSFQTLGDLFDYLNRNGIAFKDRIPAILYALRKSGVLNAEIILQ